MEAGVEERRWKEAEDGMNEERCISVSRYMRERERERERECITHNGYTKVL